MSALYTALGGTLERRDDGWYWSDGIREPRATDMLLSHLAPNFRCMTIRDQTHVEVPHDWTADKYWPQRRIDPDVARGIRELLQSRATVHAPIYAEGLAEALDDHRLTKHGWHVPIESWDVVMREHAGCWWDRAEEEAILSKARELGWKSE